jgi:hypothetical protein
MNDRHAFGDLALAVLLALPLAALAHSHQVPSKAGAVSAAADHRAPGNGRIGLLG